MVNFDTRTVTVPTAIVIPKLPAAETETFVARCGALQVRAATSTILWQYCGSIVAVFWQYFWTNCTRGSATCRPPLAVLSQRTRVTPTGFS